MKLVFLTVLPAPYQRQLFSALAAREGVQLQIFYCSATASDRAWHTERLESYETILSGWTLTSVGTFAHLNPGVISALSKADADLFVVSDYSAPTVQLAMHYLTLTNRPWVFWGELPGLSRRRAVGSWVRRRLQAPLGASVAIAGIGSRAVEAYKALFPGKPVFNVPYFCDLGRYQAARVRAGWRNGASVDVLFSGQLILRKGVDILLTAFLQLATHNAGIRLLLLGDGPERMRLEAAVPDSLKERVVFLGHREPLDLPEVFASADVFCLPSRHDGWGVVVNEALGAGLPVIVSDAVGAGRDLVKEGMNGVIVPAGDVAALAGALEQIAADSAVRARYAAASWAIGKKWGVEEGAARWHDAAQNVLAQRAAK